MDMIMMAVKMLIDVYLEEAILMETFVLSYVHQFAMMILKCIAQVESMRMVAKILVYA